MSGRTTTWRQPACCSQAVRTFVLTVNGRMGSLDKDSSMRTRELYTTRAVATQHRRVREGRSFPGKRYGLAIGPASRKIIII
eukprot:4063436-Prymnesium_polylepis.1